MPRKPQYPTQYPQATRADALSALASLIAIGAVRFASNMNHLGAVEPEINQLTVDKETSVKPRKNEVSLKSRVDHAVPSQRSLFDEVK